MIVEKETAADVAAVRAVHLATFPTIAEADLVDQLRRDGDAAISLVARDAELIVGHVVLSPMKAPMRSLGLGPVAVLPARQRQGAGRALIEAALQQARTAGWEAVFVLGDPVYYSHFGFSASAAEGFASPYAGPHLQMLPLTSAGLQAREGRIEYAPAFRIFE